MKAMTTNELKAYEIGIKEANEQRTVHQSLGGKNANKNCFYNKFNFIYI